MRSATVFFIGLLCGPQSTATNPIAEHKQPPFTFGIQEFEQGLPRGEGRWMVGLVNVFNGDSAPSQDSQPDQAIKVVMNVEVAAFKQFGVSRPDLNCDGFPDMCVLQHGGAKWGHAHVWLYDPQSGKFITSPLTRAFAKLSFADYRIDTKTRRLHLKKFSGAQILEHKYRITPEGLELESEDLAK